jgi:hypothetical protein
MLFCIILETCVILAYVPVADLYPVAAVQGPWPPPFSKAKRAKEWQREPVRLRPFLEREAANISAWREVSVSGWVRSSDPDGLLFEELIPEEDSFANPLAAAFAPPPPRPPGDPGRTLGAPPRSPRALPCDIDWGTDPVEIKFKKKGMMGIAWVPVRCRATDTEYATIEKINPSGTAAKLRDAKRHNVALREQLVLTAINNSNVSALGYDTVEEILLHGDRPMTLVFTGMVTDVGDEIEMLGLSRVKAEQGDLRFPGTFGRKRSAQPVVLLPGQGLQNGAVEILSADGQTLRKLPYVEILQFYTEDHGKSSNITFEHKPNIGTKGKNIAVYMDFATAKKCADAIMDLLNEVAEETSDEV